MELSNKYLMKVIKALLLKHQTQEKIYREIKFDKTIIHRALGQLSKYKIISCLRFLGTQARTIMTLEDSSSAKVKKDLFITC